MSFPYHIFIDYSAHLLIEIWETHTPDNPASMIKVILAVASSVIGSSLFLFAASGMGLI